MSLTPLHDFTAVLSSIGIEMTQNRRAYGCHPLVVQGILPSKELLPAPSLEITIKDSDVRCTVTPSTLIEISKPSSLSEENRIQTRLAKTVPAES